MLGDFKEGGQQNWLQVLCNGGMALELSLLYLLDLGSADLPVDFSATVIMISSTLLYLMKILFRSVRDRDLFIRCSSKK